MSDKNFIKENLQKKKFTAWLESQPKSRIVAPKGYGCKNCPIATYLHHMHEQEGIFAVVYTPDETYVARTWDKKVTLPKDGWVKKFTHAIDEKFQFDKSITASQALKIIKNIK